MGNIISRYAGLSSPVAIFALGIIAIQHLSPSEAVFFVNALMLSHMIGALPGIALAMMEVSMQSIALRKNIIIRISIVTLVCGLSGYLISDSAITMAMAATASVAAFFDIFMKRYDVEYIIPARCIQSIIIGAFLFSLLIFDYEEAEFFLLARIFSNFSIVIALIIFLSKIIDEPGKSLYIKYSSVAHSYIWLIGSNGVFIFPMLFIGQFAGGASVSYAAQSALQMAGRLSDHLTLNSIRGIPIKGKELSLTAIFAFLFLLILIYSTAKEFSDSNIVIIAILLSVASIIWGVGDSALTTYSLKSKGDFSAAASAGLIAIILTSICVIINTYFLNGLTGNYFSVVAILLGGMVYAGMAKKKA